MRGSTGAICVERHAVRSTRLPVTQRPSIRVETGSTHAVERREQIGQQQQRHHCHNQPADQRERPFCGANAELVIAPELSTIHPMSRTAAKTEHRSGRLVCRAAQRRGQRDRAPARPAAGRSARPRARSRARTASSRPCATPASAAASGCGRSSRSRPRRCSASARARADGRRRDRTACTAIRWCTTTCRRWTTTTCAAAGRPRTRSSTRRPRSWPATACSPSPSTSWRGPRPIPTPRCGSRW